MTSYEMAIRELVVKSVKVNYIARITDVLREGKREHKLSRSEVEGYEDRKLIGVKGAFYYHQILHVTNS